MFHLSVKWSSEGWRQQRKKDWDFSFLFFNCHLIGFCGERRIKGIIIRGLFMRKINVLLFLVLNSAGHLTPRLGCFLFKLSLNYIFLSGLSVNMTAALLHPNFISLRESDIHFIPGKMQGKDFDAHKTRLLLYCKHNQDEHICGTCRQQKGFQMNPNSWAWETYYNS